LGGTEKKTMKERERNRKGGREREREVVICHPPDQSKDTLNP
jgi:hypothetical protein